MPTAFAAAAETAAATLDQLAAVPIRYTRGDNLTIDTVALPGRDVTQRDRLTGAVAKHTRADSWLVKPADLVDDDQNAIIPAAGDLLTTDPDTDQARTYRVTGDANTPVWTWSGQAKTWRRIRTEPTATT